MQRIAIHSVPRSGSTWLGSIIDSNPKVKFRMQPLFSYAFKDYLNEYSTKERIGNFFKEIANSKDSFICQEEEKKRGLIPKFEKSENFTHICYKEVRYHHILENLLHRGSQIKIICLVRNPFSVIHSWSKAPKEFRNDLGWSLEEQWQNAPLKNQNKPEEFNGYEKWKEAAFLFLNLKKEFPKRVCIVQYEKLLQEPISEVERIFLFSGLNFHQQTVDFIRSSTSTNHEDAYSVFKKKEQDDAWKTQLPQYIIREIKDDPDFWRLNRMFHWI